MQTVTIPEIVERLQRLSDERLLAVFDFVSCLADREQQQSSMKGTPEALQTLIASEMVLQRDWERPEEECAWAAF